MFAGFIAVSIAFAASVVAQSSPAIVCVAGQCLQGASNITMGMKLSAPGVTTSVLLLPGQYTSTTNPQLLHKLLTSPSASLSSSPGFPNSTAVSLPLNVALQPGLAVFQQSMYSGQSSFAQLPTQPTSNSSTPLLAGSLALSSNVWVAVSSGNNRVILWESVPDVSQLPSQGALSLLDIQSIACSPPCAGSGVCSASGTCTCPAGFSGSSCESCASGFFGPTCQKCPDGCSSCDDGISGSGRCLSPIVANAPSTCNCLNGVCGGNGQCTCNAGWTTADNGTACAKCAPGFFLTSGGDCQLCQLGCTQCADGTGNCVTCKSGFTQDGIDRTKCNAVPTTKSTGEICPDGSFGSGGACQPCSPTCRTCSGPTSNDCVICGAGKYSLNGTCVGTNADGVCESSKLIANNNKNSCDSCGAKCTSCKIPNFNVASTIDLLQCTGCLPGTVLSQGKCVTSCPAGTFLSPQDNLTCQACDSSCASCSGAANFCLTCANNQLASSGKCVTTCPSNSFSSSGKCVTCHPDCASCSGSSFNQCASCPPGRPVLTNGRCLPTCTKSQFFDKTSSSCQTCDASCSSCSGSGATSCLACAQPGQIVKGGSCVPANCGQSSTVVPGMGACLSQLVAVSSPTKTGTDPVIPSGLTTPTIQTRKLQWWEILLMALGCAFIFLVVIMLWRRRARKRRAKKTNEFATSKALDRPNNWRWRMVRFGEKLFGHTASKQAPVQAEKDDIEMSRSRSSRGGSDIISHYRSTMRSSTSAPAMRELSHVSEPSLYSQITGKPPRGPQPRVPVKSERTTSRLSGSTMTSTWSDDTPLTEAAAYAAAHKQRTLLKPQRTGGANNPFRQ